MQAIPTTTGSKTNHITFKACATDFSLSCENCASKKEIDGSIAVEIEEESISGKLKIAATTPVCSPKSEVATDASKPASFKREITINESSALASGKTAAPTESGTTALTKGLTENFCCSLAC